MNNHKENRPWGSFENLLDESYCKVKKLIIKPNQRPSYQYHHKRSEHWVIVSGEAVVTIDGVEPDYSEGQYVYARNSIVVGETVAEDLGGVRVGDNLKLIMTNQGGEEESKRFVVTGISKTAGGQGFDTSVIIHIDSLRSMLDRPDESNSIFVKLNEKNPEAALDIRKQFLAAYANDDL